MNNKIRYTDEPVEGVVITSDFLPSPEELKERNATTKVTISLNKTTIDFFKASAKKHNLQYQKMIRQLLDEYVVLHKNS